MLIDFYPIPFYISLVLLALVLTVLRLKGSNSHHIIFSAIFGCYLIGAISVAVFPFSIGNAYSEFRLNLNLIPFYFGACFDYLPKNCLKDILNNILLTVPFGFGIHFVARIKPKHIFWLTFLIGCFFELTQLIMALIFHIGFRSIDINDVILNTSGAFLGYTLFKFFGWLYRKLIQKFDLKPRHIFSHVHDIVRSQN